MQCSFRRLISSRANAKLSTGPRTEAGKRRSSQNGRVHGCRSKIFLISEGEGRSDYDYYHNFYHSEYHPSTPQECVLIGQMVQAQCRRVAVLRLQRQLHDEYFAAHPLQDAPHAWIEILQMPRYLTLLDHELSQDAKFHGALNKLLCLRARARRQQARRSPQPIPHLEPEFVAPEVLQTGSFKKTTTEATL